MKLQRILMNVQISLQYFMNNTWNMDNKNFLSLNDILLESEQKEFALKEHITDFTEYLRVSMLGARRYLLKWPDENLENARKRYERMVLLDKFLKYTFFIGIALFILLKWCM